MKSVKQFLLMRFGASAEKKTKKIPNKEFEQTRDILVDILHNNAQLQRRKHTIATVLKKNLNISISTYNKTSSSVIFWHHTNGRVFNK